MHVPLRGLEFGVTGERLDLHDVRSSHGQVRAERVAQGVRPIQTDLGLAFALRPTRATTSAGSKLPTTL
jgi:hypothetical protein